MSLQPPSQSPFRRNLLQNKVALITGGGSGIGFEISKQLGLHGAKVVITGRREEVLKRAVNSLESEGIEASLAQGDVRKPQDTARMVETATSQYGGIDILVNCAAGNFLASADLLSANGFKTVMDIDTVGTYSVSKAAFPALKKSGHGVIINISATLHYGATWWQAHASAAKAAVDSLTRSLALEWGEFGIRTNGIAPGIVEGTPGANKLSGQDNHDSDGMRGFLAEIPLGRAQHPWDLGITAVYLASEAARCVNGDTIVVDGGNWLWRPQRIQREVVYEVARKVEAKSRALLPAAKSKL